MAEKYEAVLCVDAYAPPTTLSYVVAATGWTDTSVCTGTPERARGFLNSTCIVPERGAGSILYTCEGTQIQVDTCTDLVCGNCVYASQSTVCAQSSGVSYSCVNTPALPEADTALDPGAWALFGIIAGVLVLVIVVLSVLLARKSSTPAAVKEGYNAVN